MVRGGRERREEEGGGRGGRERGEGGVEDARLSIVADRVCSRNNRGEIEQRGRMTGHLQKRRWKQEQEQEQEGGET